MSEVPLYLALKEPRPHPRAVARPAVLGYLAHKKLPPPPETTIGTYA